MSKLTVKFGILNPRYVSFADYLARVFDKSNYLAEQLADKLEIEANSRGEAIDFVKQVLIEIAADDAGIPADKPGKTFRERFYKTGGAA